MSEKKELLRSLWVGTIGACRWLLPCCFNGFFFMGFPLSGLLVLVGGLEVHFT